MGLYNVKKYNFKSHDCDEIAWFDVPFAIKEYLQNTQGQILKALEVRKWRDWERLDLSQDSAENFERREKTKARLIKSDPCLFAGDQGKAIARSKLCQPRYVLEATVPIEEIRGNKRDHDLRAVIVLWGFRNGPTGCDEATALTVYNNYLDVHAKFSHFVHDGSSTSKDSPWAVGLKGKGFILSTSYLAQVCQEFKEACDARADAENRPVNDVCKTLLGMSSKPIGVGFNVGSRFCKGEYSKTNPRVLKVKKEDLRALTVTEFRQENPKGKRKDVESDDESDSEAEYGSWSHRTSSHKGDDFYVDRLRKTYKKRGELHLAEKSKQQNQTSISHPSQEHPLVRDDDVCIHVIGLPDSLTAEEAFSAVFGVFEERKVWKIPGSLFEVFQGKNKFYHRDQMVPIDSPLDNLSVNYHGDLRLSSDRMEIITHGREYRDYRARLTEALDTAVSKSPELAVLIMKSMLKSTHNAMGMIPQSTRYSTEYKAAFEAACGELFQPVYPFARRAKEEVLIRELGFFPWALDDWQMQILENSGAYIPIREHARNCLSEAEKVLATDLPGIDCLNRCVRRLIPELEHDVSIRQYRFSTPRALHREGRIVLAEPMPCKKCTESKCSCWVGAALVRIMQEYDANVDLDSIFWVYDQERKLANEQERLAGQVQTQNIMPEADIDVVQASTSLTENEAISGLAMGWGTEDGDSGNETWNGSTTVQNLDTTEDKPSSSNANYHHENANASTPKTKVTLNMENPSTAQSNTPTPFMHIRKTHATRSKSSGNALNNPDLSPRTPAHQAETPSKATEKPNKITEAVELMVPSINNIVTSAKAGDLDTVHRRLMRLTINCAEAAGVAHRARVDTSSSEPQHHHGLFETAQSNKRKRTS